MLKETKRTDPELAELVEEELVRQENCIEMIASESTVPVPIMELSGSVFTNKTLEGYPGARFQAGAEVADKMERLAWERAKALFGAEHVNIQSYSGSTANYSVFASVLKPSDKILAMRLDQGGHLTHGSPANWMSKFYNHVFYGCNKETEQIDYDELEKLAHEEKPRLIICGASSYPRLIDYERIGKIAADVGAYSMCDMAHVAGLVASKIIPSPFPYMDFVTSSTTKTFCSARSGMVFCKEKYAKLLDHGTFPGSLGSIHLHTMAAKCWSFRYAATQEFHDTMAQVVKNAQHLAVELQKRGFRIVSGGTDNHLLVVDLRNKGVTGKTMQNALDQAGISVNKNVIPFDPEKPFITSGIRIGLTSVTQRGLKEPEITEIAEIIDQVTRAPEDEANISACRKKAEALVSRFPLYPAGSFDD
ncbi:serine hydroxymethyltransferase [Oscillibacter valericigenes Sjm18-20]|nr:serine hydroxymethyltransferase [Oscillibacter valericigenes Sjm18-20]